MLNEIISEKGFSFKAFGLPIDDYANAFIKLQASQAFDIDQELAGFSDLESEDNIIRGCLNVLIAKNIKKFNKQIKSDTKEQILNKHSCEFILTNNKLYAWGSQTAIKLLKTELSYLDDLIPEPITFSFLELSSFQEKLTKIQSISLSNPKGNKLRKVKLSGDIESYTDYNVSVAGDHDISQVSGIIDYNSQSLNLSVGSKGNIKIKNKNLTADIAMLDFVLGLLK